mmetsp:Transcript_15432/g.31262  ORF Transcript_15432/g.31262 Transcript_15432/m.31262 type:complete len:90 (+) Transcript_15432:524-793(+)
MRRVQREGTAYTAKAIKSGKITFKATEELREIHAMEGASQTSSCVSRGSSEVSNQAYLLTQRIIQGKHASLDRMKYIAAGRRLLCRFSR